MNRLPPILAIALILVSCNNHPGVKPEVHSLSQPLPHASRVRHLYSADTGTIAPELLKTYKEACVHDTNSYDKKFIAHFADIIKQFSGKKLDTTLLTIGNLDGDPAHDTIITRVYYHSDSIYVDSKWIKDNQVLWTDKYTDPFTELNADVFGHTSRNTWPCFAIGILYGPPDIYPRTEMTANSMVYTQGLEDLKQAGIRLTMDQYKTYLQVFKGQLIACGDPNSRERLWIWYKPAGRMITYYQP